MPSAGGVPSEALKPREEEDGGAEPASPAKPDPQQPLEQLPKPAAVSSEESDDWLLCEETLSDSEVDEPAPPKLKSVGKAKAVSLAALLSLCCICHITAQRMLTKPQRASKAQAVSPCCPALSRLHVPASMLLVSQRASLESGHAQHERGHHAGPCCSLPAHAGQWAAASAETVVQLPLTSGSCVRMVSLRHCDGMAAQLVSVACTAL